MILYTPKAPNLYIQVPKKLLLHVITAPLQKRKSITSPKDLSKTPHTPMLTHHIMYCMQTCSRCQNHKKNNTKGTTMIPRKEKRGKNIRSVHAYTTSSFLETKAESSDHQKDVLMRRRRNKSVSSLIHLLYPLQPSFDPHPAAYPLTLLHLFKTQPPAYP